MCDRVHAPAHSGRFDPKTETKFDAWSDYDKILQRGVFGVADPIYDTIETLQWVIEALAWLFYEISTPTLDLIFKTTRLGFFKAINLKSTWWKDEAAKQFDLHKK